MSDTTGSVAFEPGPVGPFPTLWAASSGAIFAACGRALRNLESGSIRLTLPSGASRTFVGRTAGPDAHIRMRNSGLFWKSLRRGTIGFADSYVAGDWDTPDLRQVFRFFVDNKSALVQGGRGLFRVRRRDTSYHNARDNSRSGSRRNISEHYDLGNRFYEIWLDETMTYSSAMFPNDPGVGASGLRFDDAGRLADLPSAAMLARAQAAKYDAIIDALQLDAGARVLEIGCGWGGFAEHAARERGLVVDGITISMEQQKFAADRLVEARVADRATTRIVDYRDTDGTYDGIASIEMIEAVGAEHWETYFATLRDRLRPGGRAAIQAITIESALFETYRRSPDFIQRYIFPGGMLPTVDIMKEQIAAAGLELERITHFPDSYAQTLLTWRERFHARWDEIAKLGFDDRFRRLWDYYLVYCATGFEKRTIDVGIYQIVKPEES